MFRITGFAALTLILFALSLGPAVAVARTRTIDDSKGDSATGALPVYNGIWYDQTAEQNNANASLAFDGTFHISEFQPTSVTLNFTGTAISVFFIIEQPTISTCTFTLDGTSAGTYTSTVNYNGPTYLYNVSVFNVSGLVRKQHSLQLSGKLIFDYAKYTV